jgi:hypothetical protein
VRRLYKPIYESLPVVYALLGAMLLWFSYRHRVEEWSTPCAVVGLVGLVAGLMVWMRRRDYRATSADYMQRGRPVGGTADDPP